MMPQLVSLRWDRRRLHVPVLPALLVLAPLLVLALLAGLAACLIFRVPPVGALTGLGRLFWASPGTRIDIIDGHTAMQIHIR